MNEFFSWEALATLAGASAMTGLFTQSLKDSIKIPTQWLSYIIAVVILTAATLFTVGVVWPTLAINLFNAAIVSTSANGAYAAILRAKDGKTE